MSNKAQLTAEQIQEDQELQAIADKRRREHTASPKAQKDGLNDYRSKLSARRKDVADSIQTVIKYPDSDGNIRTNVVQGLRGGLQPDNALVRTNFKSRRALASKIDNVIEDIDAALRVLENGGKLRPGFTLDEYIRINDEAIAKVDTNVWETVQKPAGK
jgi:RNA polymerase-binding transcription factor DksA